MNNNFSSMLSMLSTETRENLKRGLRDRLTKKAARNKIVTLFPDEGPVRRELYVKHKRRLCVNPKVGRI
jgi:hypothetical protein